MGPHWSSQEKYVWLLSVLGKAGIGGSHPAWAGQRCPITLPSSSETVTLPYSEVGHTKCRAPYLAHRCSGNVGSSLHLQREENDKSPREFCVLSTTDMSAQNRAWHMVDAQEIVAECLGLFELL